MGPESVLQMSTSGRDGGQGEAGLFQQSPQGGAGAHSSGAQKPVSTIWGFAPSCHPPQTPAGWWLNAAIIKN